MDASSRPETTAVRTIVTATMLGHGLPKLIPLGPWPGPTGAGRHLAADGVRGGATTATVAGLTQVGAAALTASRPRSALGPTLALASMLVAVRAKAPNGIWSHDDGAEYPAVLAVLAGAAAVATPPSWTNRLLLAGGAVAGGVASFVLRAAPDRSTS